MLRTANRRARPILVLPVNPRITSSSSIKVYLTMRLSDAGLHQRQTKALYPNHRLPPWPTEDTTRDRSNRLLEVRRLGALDTRGRSKQPKSSTLNRNHQTEQNYVAQKIQQTDHDLKRPCVGVKIPVCGMRQIRACL